MFEQFLRLGSVSIRVLGCKYTRIAGLLGSDKSLTVGLAKPWPSASDL